MTGDWVTVEKDGHRINIEEKDLRKADIVVLQTGELVPADIRLTETSGIQMDEFELTGEINPVVRKAGETIRRGSKVLKGKAKGIVIAAGEETEYGKIMRQSAELCKAEKSRLFRWKYLAIVALLLPALIDRLAHSRSPAAVVSEFSCLSVALILLQNRDLFRQCLLSGMVKKLERRRISVQNPESLENLQRIDTVCWDKTGVLTARAMDVKRIYSAEKPVALGGLSCETPWTRLIKTGCALCNDILYFEKIESASAVDQALVAFAKKCGVDMRSLFHSSKRIYEMPFASENRSMACGYWLGSGKNVYFAKGDPEIILNKCSRRMTEAGAEMPMEDRSLLACRSNSMEIDRSGGTALALAFATEISDGAPADYVFLCLLHLENPLRPGAADVIRQLKAMGIRSVMLTGDRSETAAKISRDCGITEDIRAFLTGRTIERMGLAEVARQSDYCSVFARLMPSQKGIVVRLLQQRHHFVAMIGDGPNDGIALKAADAGVSFRENSSPIARRLSGILVTELSDISRTVSEAHKLKRQMRVMQFLRLSLMIAVFLSQYVEPAVNYFRFIR